VLRLLQESRGLASDPAMLRQRLLEGICRLVGAASGSTLLTQVEADGKHYRNLLAISTPTAPTRAVPCDPKLLERCLDAARCRLHTHRTLFGTGHYRARAAHGEPSRTAVTGTRQLHHCLLSPLLPSGGILVTGLILRRDNKQKHPFSRRERLLVELAYSAVGPFDPPDPIFAGSDILQLTPRQYQTLHALFSGQSEKQIGRQMGLSRHTIHHYFKAIYQQFGVSSRGELDAHWLTHASPKLPVTPPRRCFKSPAIPRRDHDLLLASSDRQIL
jgi:DNA-binding CsgD family transcriptional regulator